MSFTKSDGNHLSKSNRVLPVSAPALAMTQREGQMTVAQALQSAVGYGKRAARSIAEAVQCNERTALAWVNGDSTPDFVHTLRLMATIPEFAAECRRLSGMMADCDPELQRDLNQLMTRWQRRMAMEGS